MHARDMHQQTLYPFKEGDPVQVTLFPPSGERVEGAGSDREEALGAAYRAMLSRPPVAQRLPAVEAGKPLKESALSRLLHGRWPRKKGAN